MHLVLQLLDKEFVLEIQIRVRILFSQMLSLVQCVALSSTTTYHRVVSPQTMLHGAMKTALFKTEIPILSALTTLQWICTLIVQATTLLIEVPHVLESENPSGDCESYERTYMVMVVMRKEAKSKEEERKCKRSLASSMIKVWKVLLEVHRSKLKGLFSLNGDEWVSSCLCLSSIVLLMILSYFMLLEHPVCRNILYIDIFI